MTIVCVTGGRAYGDAERLGSVLDAFHRANPITLLLQGGASGADCLAHNWATARRIPVRTFTADWQKHGPAAEPIRNRRMIVEGEPEIVIAFPGGKGTASCIRIAQEHNIDVLQILSTDATEPEGRLSENHQ